MEYAIDDLVRMAKRENNTVRPYLFVNPMQGKHIPSEPGQVMKLCHDLANLVNAAYPKDRLYVIGFAETATGIAAGVSHYLDHAVYYQNTTREYRDDQEYLYFTESHSHATDQMLRSDGLRESLGGINRILFIDDEITTGNTICKLIQAFQKTYPMENIRFSIVSILNSMSDVRRMELERENIDCVFLLKIPFEYKKDSIMDISFQKELHHIIDEDDPVGFEELVFDTVTNVRRITEFEEYESENNRFSDLIENSLKHHRYMSVLILGTEEFMYPAFSLGKRIKEHQLAEEVRIHATTRSPVIASDTEGYPLFERYQIRSFYDEDRITFIYNLKKYDKVIIVTDAKKRMKSISDLIHALRHAGNDDITLARWQMHS